MYGNENKKHIIRQHYIKNNKTKTCSLFRKRKTAGFSKNTPRTFSIIIDKKKETKNDQCYRESENESEKAAHELGAAKKTVISREHSQRFGYKSCSTQPQQTAILRSKFYRKVNKNKHLKNKSKSLIK